VYCATPQPLTVGLTIVSPVGAGRPFSLSKSRCPPEARAMKNLSCTPLPC
jgi:hypothetical protein